MFLILSICFGCYFVVKVPLLWGSDETFHTMRIYQIAQGHLRSDFLGDTREKGGFGGAIPTSLHELVLNVNHDQFNNVANGNPPGTKNVDDPSIYRRIGGLKLMNGASSTYAFPNTAAYSPVPYLPMVFGMRIAQWLNPNLLQTIMFMRLLGLASFVGIIYYSLRLLRGQPAQWLVFVVALLPMTVFQSAIITADTLTIAISLLFFSLVVYSLSADRFTLVHKLLLLATTISIPLLKPGYLLLVPLILLVPNRHFERMKSGLLYKVGVIGVTFILVMAWNYLTRDVADAVSLIKPGNGEEYIHVTDQLGYIFTSPLAYLTVVARTLLLSDARYITEMLGSLGFNVVFLPGAAILSTALSLLLATIASGRQVISRRVSYILLASVVLCFGSIVTTIYLTFTKVGGPEVSGIQGRYLIPLVPPLLLGIGKLVDGRLAFSIALVKTAYYHYVMYALVTFSLLAAAIKYTYVTWG